MISLGRPSISGTSWSTKNIRRTFIHVIDIARAIIHVMDPELCHGHKVFNVGNNSLNYTKADIISLLQKRLDFWFTMLSLALMLTKEIMRLIILEYSRLPSKPRLTSTPVFLS